ncbi:MAG: helix-hairpin-helix domain-containing protein [Eubacterium sp.]|jgi:competence protein ComEA|nr:helix-hairpin-helix domain-containing protein [Eubacterium sp.]
MKIINILGLAIVMLLSLTACGSKGILVETMEEEGTEAVFGEISANASDSDAADTEDVVASEDTITVYVCGAVVQEGVYELPAGSRISDALLMAGGYDENALHGYVNLAERLEDGERIYFPDYQELEELGIVPISSTESSESGLVNINTADAEMLKTLPGIGDAKAADIIAYREEHGAFSSIEDIKNVSGIGESIYNRISSGITVN